MNLLNLKIEINIYFFQNVILFKFVQLLFHMNTMIILKKVFDSFILQKFLRPDLTLSNVFAIGTLKFQELEYISYIKEI